mmetsp:Transcript_44790/g.139355  ORF Transcript_44790/g.139355 Transcript_44790/m.139355 type:complete len:323 (+) Transcript_44790:872-1840(+)
MGYQIHHQGRLCQDNEVQCLRGGSGAAEQPEDSEDPGPGGFLGAGMPHRAVHPGPGLRRKERRRDGHGGHCHGDLPGDPEGGKAPHDLPGYPPVVRRHPQSQEDRQRGGAVVFSSRALLREVVPLPDPSPHCGFLHGRPDGWVGCESRAAGCADGIHQGQGEPRPGAGGEDGAAAPADLHPHVGGQQLVHHDAQGQRHVVEGPRQGSEGGGGDWAERRGGSGGHHHLRHGLPVHQFLYRVDEGVRQGWGGAGGRLGGRADGVPRHDAAELSELLHDLRAEHERELGRQHHLVCGDCRQVHWAVRRRDGARRDQGDVGEAEGA